MSASPAQVRLLFTSPLNLGPGKIRLLQAIGETGSISGAARQLHISYRRAWLMADGLNKGFPSPLIDTSAGGVKGGGARLTPLGEQVIGRYLAMVARMEGVIAADVAEFMRLLD